MFPLIGSMITGGLGLLGGMFSSDTAKENTQANVAMQRETNEFNAQQAQINRNYQTEMSNTAYQRANQDMQKAGLNPAMMFGSGSAASSPSGSVATGQAPRSELKSPFADLGKIAEAAVQSAVSMKTVDKLQEEIANIQASTELRKAETDTERERPGLVSATKTKTRDEGIAVRNRLPVSELEGLTAKDIESMDPETRKWLNRMGWGGQKVSDTIAPVVSSAGALRGFAPKTMSRSVQKAPDGSFDEFWQSRTGWSK